MPDEDHFALTPLDGTDQPPLLSPDVAAQHIAAAVAVALNAPPGGLTFVRTTAGSGKSTAARRALERSPAEAIVLVPTHDLATEYGQDLPESAVSVRRGVTGLRVLGQHECVHHEVASRYARLGIDPIGHLCSSCSSRETHLRTGPQCKAYLDATAPSRSRIRVAQNTRAAEIILSLTRAHRGVEEKPVLILDEPPPVARAVSLRAAPYLMGLFAACRPSTLGRLGPLLLRSLGALRRDDVDGLSLRDLLIRDGLKPADADRIFSEGRRTEFVLSADGARDLADAVRKSGDIDLGHARVLVDVIREAAFMPSRPFVYRDDAETLLCSRAPWVRALQGWLRSGGTALLLDATGDPRALRSLGMASSRQTPTGDQRETVMHIVEIHVTDAPGVERIFRRWGSAARRWHVEQVDGEPRPRASEMQGVLRHLAGVVRRHGGPFGIITDRPTALAIQKEYERSADANHKSWLLPTEFAALAVDGIELRVGWFGNHRGRNAWNGVRVHATIGDPHPNLGEIRAEARLLGLHPQVLLHHRREAEREQASQRARPTWNAVSMIHYGKTVPDRKAYPQWEVVAIQESRDGRPRRVINGKSGSASELNEERIRLGLTKRAHAKLLGLPVGTYMDRTREAADNGTPSSPPAGIGARTNIVEVRASARDLYKAIQAVGIVKPSALHPQGGTGVLVVARNDTCLVISRNRGQIAYASVPAAVEKGGQFVLPIAMARGLRHAAGEVTVHAREEAGECRVEYRADRGSSVEGKTFDPRLFVGCISEINDVSASYAIPAAVLREALLLARPFVAKGPVTRDEASLQTIQLFDGHETRTNGERLSRANGFLVATDGIRHCWIQSDALKDRRLAVAGEHIALVMAFLAKCNDRVTIKHSPTRTFLERSDGTGVGWANTAATHERFGYYARSFDKILLDVPSAEVMRSIGFARCSMPPNCERVRLVFDNSLSTLRLRVNETGARSESPPVHVGIASNEVGAGFSASVNIHHLTSLFDSAKCSILQLRVAILQKGEAGCPGTGFLFRTIEEFTLGPTGKVAVDGSGADSSERIAGSRCTVTRFTPGIE